MNLFLAHADETHATNSEATVHASKNNLALILVTITALLAVLFAARLLSKWGSNRSSESEVTDDD